jgi:capsule polysaccharide export protein KpsE/RkpR
LVPTGTRPQIEEPLQPLLDEPAEDQMFSPEARAKTVEQLRFLWLRRNFLAKIFGVGLLAGLLIALLIPVRYDSTVQLMPPDSQSGSGAMMMAALTAKAGATSALGSMAGDLLGVKSNGALFVGVLGSRTVLDRLVQRFDLKKVYSVRLDEDARRKLAQKTNIAEDRKSGIISITVTDHDPNRAAALSGAYVEELNQLTAELSTSGAHRERVFLEGRLAAVKKDLDDASVKFSQFASKNATIDIKDQGRAMVEAASRLEGERIAVESELRGLEQIYTTNNIRVRATQARIAELQTQIEKMGGKPGASGGQTGSASSPAGQTQDSSQELYPSIRELPLLGVTWADLYRNSKIQETVFEVLTQQYELAKVDEAKETPSVKVLDPPIVPERKSFPPRGLITIFVGFLFLGIAIVGLFFKSQWNETDANDPGKQFAQEVFHSVSSHLPWTTGNGTQTESRNAWKDRVDEKGSADKTESRSKLS